MIWTKSELERRAREYGLDTLTTFWGRTGYEIVSQIESRIGMPLTDELREFAENIGAVNLPPLMLFVTGSVAPDGGELSSATETQHLWRDFPETDRKLVVIGWLYETLYCWAPQENKIRQYYRYAVDLAKPEEEWDSLSAFLDSMLPYLQSLGVTEDEDDDFDI